jgi:hypothetical protein
MVQLELELELELELQLEHYVAAVPCISYSIQIQVTNHMSLIRTWS